MSILNKDVREFIELLNSENVKYLIVGGHAVAFHGYPRFTGDIDIFIKASGENAEKMLRVFSSFGVDELSLSREDFTHTDRIIQLGVPPNRIDVVTSVTGVTFTEAWASRNNATLDGVAVPIIGKEMLLKNKRATGRPKDLADIEQLE